MHLEAREELSLRLKLTVLEHAKYFGATEAYREFNVPRSSFYRWKQTYMHEGRAGLSRKKPIAYSHPRKTAPEVVEKILELRRAYQIGALRIVFYLECYHGVKISESTVTRVLRTHRVSSLPKTAPRRAIHSKHYAKTVPRHHVRVDVKFLNLKDEG